MGPAEIAEGRLGTRTNAASLATAVVRKNILAAGPAMLPGSSQQERLECRPV